MNIKVLVTGGTGFLGGHIAESLSKKEALSLLTPSRKNLDLADRKSVESYLLAHKPEIVVHAAAFVGGLGAHYKNNFSFLVANTTIDSNLLGVCADLNISKVVTFGSSCMYPPGTGRALSEQEMNSSYFEETNEGYAIAKKHLWDLVRLSRERDGLSWSQIVLSNLYGPGDNFDPKTSHLIAAITTKLLAAVEESQPNIEIWGSGRPRREFTFVTDVSQWLSEFIQTPASKWPESLNLGFGKDYSVKELYEMAADILGWKGDFVLDPSKPDGAMDKLMDSSKARAFFGWRPQTTIGDGIRRTLQSRKDQL